ncbi:nuclear transport factor 2 family protein [Mycolicibacterium aubagnense]|uniref:SnoaL-like domain-containing protein n=1 Tax=Mycolicibacterium aubagnense TaxID=319707 RepID=A0ABM7ICP2_9MYCO|nr:nuclear transport factor 2 family protein [Mycolicibacterium aubagnense]WGI33737.1 nuclear transport factor 2 family protein [Mycolicibacterium aubagnense]BBX84505.1 hypothetical protein MAUB_23780 [Mycolicibacterium aubagnense]
MTREGPPTERCRAWPGGQRVLQAVLALGAAAALSAGTASAHATSMVQAAEAVSTMSTVASITDPDAETAAVELLKATYFNDVDTKNWQALSQLFTPDAVVDTTGSFGPYFPNRDSFIAFTSLTLSAINTRHQGYDPQVNLTSDTTASVVWTMQDRLSLAGLVTIHGYGNYTDNYAQVNGQWLITYSKLTRTGFTLEFPAFQDFATGLANAYNTGGVVGALRYVVPAVVNIPINAVKALVGAIGSNFGGPAAKAEPITVPPGSTGVTTEPPGITSTAATPAAQTRAVATAAATSKSGSSAKSLATDAAGTSAKPTQPTNPGPTQHAVADKLQAATGGASTQSPKTPHVNAPTSGATDRTNSTTSANTSKPTTSAHSKS